MSRRVVISNNAQRDLRRITDRPTLRRLMRAIEALADEPYPSGSKKLGGVGTVWRIREGGWRICYTVDDGELIVLVLVVARRGDVYDRLRRRLG